MQKLKPFIKWAGGKGQLLSEIKKRLPSFILDNEKFNYVEPFIGSGAVLFHLINNYAENMNKIIINDLNKRLIYLYEAIIERPLDLIDRINKIEIQYKQLSEEDRKSYYLRKRKTFNSLNIVAKNRLDISAYFLFLNKTGFNGMYRENKQGDYNIPFGKQKNPSFLNESNILNISQALAKKVEIRNESYEKIFCLNNSFKTFYYLDPPYMPINNSSSFTDYIKESDFHTTESLQKISDYCIKIKSLNGSVLLSNSDTKVSNSILSTLGEISKIKARRSINSNGKKRGDVGEILLLIS